MAIQYWHNNIGTFTLKQKERDIVDGQVVEMKDENGKQIWREFKIQLREANVLFCALNIYKQDEPEDPSRPYVHQMVSFFVDEQHLKRCFKKSKTNNFEYWLSGKLTNIRLNLYYKDARTLLKYFIKDGYKVYCYYAEPKK